MQRCNAPATHYATTNGYRLCAACYECETDKNLFQPIAPETGRCDRPMYHVRHQSFPIVTLGATEHNGCYSHNTHRVVIGEVTAAAFIGWPDPTDKRNSDAWKPGIDRPLIYPKFAWELYN